MESSFYFSVASCENYSWGFGASSFKSYSLGKGMEAGTGIGTGRLGLTISGYACGMRGTFSSSSSFLIYFLIRECFSSISKEGLCSAKESIDNIRPFV